MNNRKNVRYFGVVYHLKYRFCSALACGLVIDYIRAQNGLSQLTRGEVQNHPVVQPGQQVWERIRT